MSKRHNPTTQEMARDIQADAQMCLHMVDLLRVAASSSEDKTVQLNAKTLIFATDYLIEALIMIGLNADEILTRKS